MKEIFRGQNSGPFPAKSPALLPDVSAGYCKRHLVDETEIKVFNSTFILQFLSSTS
jgi:hypothetical protein